MHLEKAVVAGDTQIPSQDDKAVELFFQFLKDYKPDRIFLNGDIIDLYNLSDYDKSPHFAQKLKKELEDTKDFLAKLRKTCPKAKIDFIAGNHEFRFERYLYKKAPELAEIMSIEELLNLKEYDIAYHNLPKDIARYTDNFIEYKHFLIGHFAKVNQHGGYTAKSLVDKFGKSVIQNHTHRIGAHIRKVYDGLIEGYESGSLCAEVSTYGTFNNWAKGWGMIESYGNQTHYYQIVIKENKFIYNGKLYS